MNLEHFKEPDESWIVNEYILSEACRLPEPGQHFFLSLLINGNGAQELEADFGAGRYLRPNQPGVLVFGDEQCVPRLHGIGPYHAIATYIRKDEFFARTSHLLDGKLPSLEPLLAKFLIDPALEILMKRLINAYRSPGENHDNCRDVQDDLISRLLTLAEVNVPSVENDDVLRPHSIQRVIDYMHANPDRDLRRDELAAIAGVVPGHFTRLFRQTVGETPKRFHLQIRIRHAAILLQTSPEVVSIVTLAKQCGFFNPSHFGYEFKRQIGIGPDAYRAYYLRKA